jgi:hypothetical protein
MADLSGASFRRAILKETVFSSKSSLNGLKFRLSDEQMLSAIFLDEAERAQIRGDEKSELRSLKIEIEDAIQWDLMDFGLFFMCLQKTYNNVLYLKTTDETDIEKIREQLYQNKWHPGADNNIALNSIQTGSWVIEILQSEPLLKEFIVFFAVITGALNSVRQVFKIQKDKLDVEKGKEELKKLRRENEQVETAAEKQIVPFEQAFPAELKDTLQDNIKEIDFGDIQNPTVDEHKVALFALAGEPTSRIFYKLKHAGVKKFKINLVEPDSTG